MVREEIFGKTENGVKVYKFVFSNGGTEAEITNYGASVISLRRVGFNGDPVDIVCGYRPCPGMKRTGIISGPPSAGLRDELRAADSCLTAKPYFSIKTTEKIIFTAGFRVSIKRYGTFMRFGRTGCLSGTTVRTEKKIIPGF